VDSIGNGDYDTGARHGPPQERTHRDRWGVALTTLMAVTDLLPVLDEDDRFLHGIVAVANDARESCRAPTVSHWEAMYRSRC
jgi:hypothetical protein